MTVIPNDVKPNILEYLDAHSVLNWAVTCKEDWQIANDSIREAWNQFIQEWQGPLSRDHQHPVIGKFLHELGNEINLGKIKLLFKVLLPRLLPTKNFPKITPNDFSVMPDDFQDLEYDRWRMLAYSMDDYLDLIYKYDAQALIVQALRNNDRDEFLQAANGPEMQGVQTLFMGHANGTLNCLSSEFYEISLPNLTVLGVHHHNLNYIPELAFKNFPNLRTLWLNNNNISHLPVDLFANNPNLRYLGIHNNPMDYNNLNVILPVDDEGNPCTVVTSEEQLSKLRAEGHNI